MSFFQLFQYCLRSGNKLLVTSLSSNCYLPHAGRAVKSWKQQADNEQQAPFELAPKGQALEGQGIQGYFENQSLGNGVSRGFQEVFPTADAMLFRQNARKTGNNAVQISLRFKRFTGLNLLEYEIYVVQNWETDALQFCSMVLIFCQQLWQKEMKVAGQGWLTSRRFWLATGPN